MDTDSYDSKEILKNRLAKGEISVKEYEEILKILDEQRASASEHVPHEPLQSEQKKDSTDVFEFTGIKKFFFYILIAISAISILMLVFLYLLNSSLDPELNETTRELLKDLFNIDGTILHYIVGDPPYNRLVRWFIPRFLAFYTIASPLLMFYFYFEMRAFKKNKTKQKYNHLISISQGIVGINFIGIIYTSKDMISIIMTLCCLALICFVFWKAAMLPKKEDKL